MGRDWNRSSVDWSTCNQPRKPGRPPSGRPKAFHRVCPPCHTLSPRSHFRRKPIDTTRTYYCKLCGKRWRAKVQPGRESRPG